MALFSKRKNRREAAVGSCSAVIAAAGLSARMGGVDKLYAEIGGKPVLAHSLIAYQNCPLVNEIIVVARSDMLEATADMCKQYGIGKASKVIAGGATRFESVSNGVFAVSKEADLIAIHDGARPCVAIREIMQAVTDASKYNAAAVAVPVISTIKKVENGTITQTIDRECLYEMQTPQVFDADLIKCALSKAASVSDSITDDCMAVELLGAKIHITEGSRSNVKLTVPDDTAIAEMILTRELRI